MRVHAARALTALGLLAVAVRLTVADRWSGLSALYYGLPLIGVAVLLLLAALLGRGRVARRETALLVLAAVAAAAAWHAASWRRNACEDAAAPLRVLFWNVQRGRGGYDQVVAAVRGANADIIGLVEAGGNSAEWHAYWRSRFPDHDVWMAGAGIVLIARGRIASAKLVHLEHRSFAGVAVVRHGGLGIRVVLVDLYANPLLSRRRRVELVLRHAGPRGNNPTVVLGDFNTPLDSIWLDGFRARFTHAFSAAGEGLVTTWPSWLPLLAIDHVWVGPALRVACARHVSTGLSDHRQVVVDLVPAPPAPPPPG